MPEVKNEGEGKTPEAPEGNSPSEKGQQLPESVPYSRFQETVGQKNTLQKRADELEEAKSDLEKRIEELEGKDNLSKEEKDKLGENKKDLSKLVSEELERINKNKTERQEREQRDFEKSVDKQMDTFPDVERDKFLKFMEDEADKYGVKSVDGGMKLYRKLNDLTKETQEKAKKDILGKPNMPRSEGSGGSTAKTPESDKGKSLNQIAEEAVREAEGR